VTSVSHECGQRQDERAALSSTLTSDVNESEHVDDKREDDVLCDLPSRHLNVVSSRMFGDAVEVVDMSQIYDTKLQNLLDQVTDSSGRRKNTVVEKSHVCNERHKAFKMEQMKQECIDAVERPYVCDICTEAFMTSSVLTSHRQTHTGDTCRKCDVRQKIFAHLLKRHKLTHTDEKPYQCDMCRKKCTERPNLNTHNMLTDEGERSDIFECNLCLKQFTRRSYLKKHMLIHTGERPHKCDVCQKTFAQRSHLKSHLLTHTIVFVPMVRFI